MRLPPSNRSVREQEADVFRRAIGALKLARDAEPISRDRRYRRQPASLAGCHRPDA